MSKDQPFFFENLNLDKIVDTLVKQTKRPELAMLYYNPPHSLETVLYRQHILRELENHELRHIFADFSEKLTNTENEIKKVQNIADPKNYLVCGYLLDACDQYQQQIQDLSFQLSSFMKENGSFKSEGLKSFYSYLTEYTVSTKFKESCNDVLKTRQQLSTVTYCMDIKDRTINICKFKGEENLTEKVCKTFGKFGQEKTQKYGRDLQPNPVSDHVETEVLRHVAFFYPHPFSVLRDFCKKYKKTFTDSTLFRFAAEIQFYLSWQNFIQIPRQHNLHFCYPDLHMPAESKKLYDTELFDLALADKDPSHIVTNDFILTEPERIIVITGPNQGGKTTFARALGQIEYLASLGLCVPGTQASLILPDTIYTHFNVEEDENDANGKLQNDLIRLKNLLDKATRNSMIIINEIFASTTVADAVKLGQYMMDELVQKKAFTVCITFLDELAHHGKETVSMTSTVCKDNPELRTYKIKRGDPEGLAYAVSLAEKHGLTYAALSQRLNK